MWGCPRVVTFRARRVAAPLNVTLNELFLNEFLLPRTCSDTPTNVVMKQCITTNFLHIQYTTFLSIHFKVANELDSFVSRKQILICGCCFAWRFCVNNVDVGKNVLLGSWLQLLHFTLQDGFCIRKSRIEVDCILLIWFSCYLVFYNYFMNWILKQYRCWKELRIIFVRVFLRYKIK